MIIVILIDTLSDTIIDVVAGIGIGVLTDVNATLLTATVEFMVMAVSSAGVLCFR